MYGGPLCRLCMAGDFGWLVGAVAGVSWGSNPCWGCSGGMIGAVMGMGQGLPGAFCIKDTLAGQLKLLWVQIGVSQDAKFRRHPGSRTGAKWGQAGVSWSAMCWGVPQSVI